MIEDQRLVNAMKSRAAHMDASHPATRYGVVQSVSPADCTVRVLLQPEAILSGWLPVLMPALGKGWGLVALPDIGQQVLLLSEYGDANSAVVVGTAFSDTNQPPKVATTPAGTTSYIQPGEIALVGKAGAVLRVCADGSIYLQASTVNIAGNLIVQGDVSDRHGSVDRLRQNYNQHVHGGVQAGAGNTDLTSRADAT